MSEAMADDEDVIFEGSPLHQYLVENGFQDCETVSLHPDPSYLQQKNLKKKNLHSGDNSLPTSDNNFFGKKWLWPENKNLLLEVEMSKLIMESGLLVEEDKEFVANFILSESVLNEYEKQNASNVGLDFLMLTGSVAAVAGAMYYLSSRSRVPSSVLPSALAMISSIRLGAKMSSMQASANMQKLVDILLEDMKSYKKILRKSVHLIQGFEYINCGYTYGHVSSVGSGSGKNESQLTKALSKRSTLPALRQAIYSSTYQLLVKYRESIKKLFIISPLMEHIDHPEHYLATIELSNFNLLEKLNSEEVISLSELKDIIQLLLLQQSEYLRRFSLSFCPKVRCDELNSDKLKKHIIDIGTVIHKLTLKLYSSYEYHQALGVKMEQESRLQKQQHLYINDPRFFQLKNIYQSLYSTGLHLQNSLLKVRSVEEFFEYIERKNADKSKVDTQIPSTVQINSWLQGFNEIHTELNACITCLEDGVSNINAIQGNNNVNSSPKHGNKLPTIREDSNEKDYEPKVIPDKDPVHFDEVFEAEILEEFQSDEILKKNDVGVFDDEVTLLKEQDLNSQKVLQELKNVLVHKKKEMDIREANAVARKKGDNSHLDDINLEETNVEIPIIKSLSVVVDTEEDTNNIMLSSGICDISCQKTLKEDCKCGENKINTVQRSNSDNSQEVKRELKSNENKNNSLDDDLIHEKRNPLERSKRVKDRNPLKRSKELPELFNLSFENKDMTKSRYKMISAFDSSTESTQAILSFEDSSQSVQTNATFDSGITPTDDLQDLYFMHIKDPTEIEEKITSGLIETDFQNSEEMSDIKSSHLLYIVENIVKSSSQPDLSRNSVNNENYKDLYSCNSSNSSDYSLQETENDTENSICSENDKEIMNKVYKKPFALRHTPSLKSLPITSKKIQQTVDLNEFSDTLLSSEQGVEVSKFSDNFEDFFVSSNYENLNSLHETNSHHMNGSIKEFTADNSSCDESQNDNISEEPLQLLKCYKKPFRPAFFSKKKCSDDLNKNCQKNKEVEIDKVKNIDSHSHSDIFRPLVTVGLQAEVAQQAIALSKKIGLSTFGTGKGFFASGNEETFGDSSDSE